jgi:hypothetical protein
MRRPSTATQVSVIGGEQPIVLVFVLVIVIVIVRVLGWGPTGLARHPQ